MGGLPIVGRQTSELPFSTWQLPLFEHELHPGLKNKVAKKGYIPLAKSNGEEFYFNLIKFTIEDKGVNAVSWVTVIVDITARINAGLQLEQINQQLEQQVLQRTQELQLAKEKAEMATRSKAEFLANMSHEIRTPLNTILGLAHVALNSDINKKVRIYLENMRNSGKHLLNVINDILNFSRLEVGKLELENVEFSILEVVDSTVNLVKEKANGKGIALNVDVDSNIPCALVGDPLRISQILINLSSNAVKFTDEGEVSISVSQVKRSDHEVTLEFIVKDTGIGIDGNLLDCLFNPFQQLDNSSTRKFEGSGLGLAICKNLCDLMQGTLSVKSRIDEGTEFTLVITLPYIKGASVATSTFKNRHVELTSLKPLERHILLVEDNKLNGEVTASLLHLMGAKTQLAYSGEEALIEIANTQYDLILMDIQMPGMDGLQTTRKLRSESFFCPPIVAMTANALHGDREWYLNQGFSDYLAKPIEPMLLYRCIKLHTKTDNNTMSIPIPKDDCVKDFQPLRDADINVEEALVYFLDNNNLYIEALRKFSLQRQGFINELNLFLEKNDFVMATNQVHSLASLAAMLGFTKMSKYARTLEGEFNNHVLDVKLINDLAAEMRRILTLLQAWFYTNPEDQTSPET